MAGKEERELYTGLYDEDTEYICSHGLLQDRR